MPDGDETTIPWPKPVESTLRVCVVGGGVGWDVAVTVKTLFIVNVQAVAQPLQPPLDQPVNGLPRLPKLCPCRTLFRSRVISVPLTKSVRQAGGHTMPDGDETTTPWPNPIVRTLRLFVPAADTGDAGTTTTTNI